MSQKTSRTGKPKGEAHSADELDWERLSLVWRRLKFHHFIIPIAAAVVAIGLAVIAAPRTDLELAIGNVLIVFGVFCIASYVVVRAVELADQRRKQAPSKEE
jgi:hypothetical protein